MITYSAQVLSSLMMVAMVLFMIIMSVPAINRVYEVLMEVPSIKIMIIPFMKFQMGILILKMFLLNINLMPKSML